MTDAPRSPEARAIVNAALVRVLKAMPHEPELVLIGGLVAELLCDDAPFPHAGTTDIDVQVNRELDRGSTGAPDIARALREAGFEPTENRSSWRWTSLVDKRQILKFEFLADIPGERNESTVEFISATDLGAVNLRGTGYAIDGAESRILNPEDPQRAVSIKVAGLAGWLMAKLAASRNRRAGKDWYDLAYVIQFNGNGSRGAAKAIVDQFGKPTGTQWEALEELRANFREPYHQGAAAYADQASIEDPTVAVETHAADAVTAMTTFCDLLLDD